MNNNFIAIGDIHIGARPFGLSETYEGIKTSFKNVYEYAFKNNINKVIICGDLFDHNRPSQDLVLFVKKIVKDYEAVGVITEGITGDHDSPINNQTWMHVCGITNPTGALIGFDYDLSPQHTVNKLKAISNKKEIEFIFFHGQLKELYPFGDEKKVLDLKQIDFKEFSNLKYIVMGDLHNLKHVNKENTVHGYVQKIPIVYTGSLEPKDKSEITKPNGILLWKDNKMERVVFPLSRSYHLIEFNDDYQVDKSIFIKEEVKPVYIIEYTRSVKCRLLEWNFLNEIGFIKKIPKKEDNTKEQVSLRQDLKTGDKIAAALRLECSDELFDIAYELLKSEDPISILDKFKKEKLICV